MNDPYDEILALEEQRQSQYWEALEWEQDSDEDLSFVAPELTEEDLRQLAEIF
jgi:hypothetical protein